jgi:1-aminocyclopropane-1-carboxylate deaminase/D-cysteine desulfhydrase-like pyridoxal-dependent ACC family enzyme
MSPRRGSVRARGGGRGRRGGRGRAGGRGGGSGGARAGRERGGLSRRAFLGTGLGAIGILAAGGMAGSAYGFGRLNAFDRHDPDRLAELRAGSSSPLLERYPGLADHIPWQPLSSLTAPIEELPTIAGSSDVRLFVKRDDVPSPLCGGASLRKLEHLLADARAAGSSTLVAVGAAGTEFGLAAALHAGALGLGVRLALFDQPVTSYVRRNLLGLAAAGAQLQYSRGIVRSLLDARRMHDEDDTSYLVMPGGSTRLGTFGSVNAAFELADQVRAGALPEPDRIFIAAATCGAAAGLIAGCQLAGLRSRVTAVRVAPPLPAHAVTIRAMARDVAWFLHETDYDVPRLRIGFGDFDVVTDQLGAGYGHQTEAASAALDWARPLLTLEPTCTAKALAACLQYCRARARPGETVLFWNTTSSATVPQAQPGTLPPALRAVFERPDAGRSR